MNFRYKLMQFLSGRYGVDTLFYILFFVAAALSVVNCFVRSVILQSVVYVIVIYAFFRTFSRNIPARRRENKIFTDLSFKLKQKRQTYQNRKADYTHIYKKCPRCKAVLRLPRRVGKHTTICPKCGNEFSVRVYK